MSKLERYQLVDESDRLVKWVSTEEARDLLSASKAEALWHKRRIYALRLISLDPLPARPVALRRRGFGDSHRHETDVNPPKVWTIDYLKAWAHLELVRVLESCRPPKDLHPGGQARKTQAKKRAA